MDDTFFSHKFNAFFLKTVMGLEGGTRVRLLSGESEHLF